MLENTNKAIAYNSIVLYGKMGITTFCALLTTRFALQALGLVDYGLYAVLGGIISFISIFNTIMLSTSNRFIAMAIGRGNVEDANKQFNVNLLLHVAIAVFVLLIAFPIGNWYIPRYVSYEGPLSNAMMVYAFSVVGSVVSFVGVPYNGLLMAKEKFVVFSLVDVVLHVVKLLVAWMLVYHFEHKLFIYSLTMALVTGASTLIYIIYCSLHYHNVVRLRFVRNRDMYKSVLGFSSWVAVGAVAHVGKVQGAALVVNTFFNTVMNTAMGIASSINAYIHMFAQNLTQPMAPQITKSYAVGNRQRTDDLLIMSTKYSFLLTLLVSSVFLAAPDFLLKLWLGKVPPYASIFLILFIIDNLVQSMNSGVQNIIFASGKLALYQMVISLSNVLSVIVGYMALRGGAEAYYMIAIYICFSIIKFFAVQWVLHYTLHYDNRMLWKNSYFPSLLIVVLFVPMLFLLSSIHPIIRIAVVLSYLMILEFVIGLSKRERQRLLGFIKNIKNK